MIAKISRGWRIGGLVRYLLGPGRFNEHVDPRVVAAWDGDAARHQPAQDAGGGFDVRDLVAALGDPAVAAGVPQQTPSPRADGRVPRGPVWHCSLRNSAEDEPLSDEEWASVVEDLLDRTGIAPKGDLGACRWVAIRHAHDHVHVAALLVRQDTGRRVHPRNDFLRARETCRDAERRFGLTATAPADRTAPISSTRPEAEKAARRGADEPSRVWLRRAARTAAVQARDAQGYFARLQDLGVIVRPRYGPGPDGAAIGYAVAAPGDLAADGGPIWFSGGSLARDLTLPRLVARWSSAPAPSTPIPPQPSERSTVGREEREAAVDEAVEAMEQALEELRSADGSGPDDETTRDSIAHATGDMGQAVGSATTRRGSAEEQELQREVGDALDRATRTADTVQPHRWSPAAGELRRSAWRLAGAGRGIVGPQSSPGTRLLVALVQLVAAMAALREEQSRTAQACAARRSSAALHTIAGRPAHRARAAGPGPQQRTRAGHGPGRGSTGPERAGTAVGRAQRGRAQNDRGRGHSP